MAGVTRPARPRESPFSKDEDLRQFGGSGRRWGSVTFKQRESRPDGGLGGCGRVTQSFILQKPFWDWIGDGHGLRLAETCFTVFTLTAWSTGAPSCQTRAKWRVTPRSSVWSLYHPSSVMHWEYGTLAHKLTKDIGLFVLICAPVHIYAHVQIHMLMHINASAQIQSQLGQWSSAWRKWQVQLHTRRLTANLIWLTLWWVQWNERFCFLRLNKNQ